MVDGKARVQLNAAQSDSVTDGVCNSIACCWSLLQAMLQAP
jgi:hypothetical protein